MAASTANFSRSQLVAVPPCRSAAGVLRAPGRKNRTICLPFGDYRGPSERSSLFGQGRRGHGARQRRPEPEKANMRRMLLWLAIGMLGTVSPAAAITVYNCDGSSQEVELYDSFLCSNLTTHMVGKMTIASCRSHSMPNEPTNVRVVTGMQAPPPCNTYPTVSEDGVILKGGRELRSLVFFNNTYRGKPDWANNCACSEDQIPK
jgi:hypothetical protein